MSKTNILVSGLFYSGSGAAHDLLRQYSTVGVIPGEFDDFRRKGMIADHLSGKIAPDYPSHLRHMHFSVEGFASAMDAATSLKEKFGIANNFKEALYASFVNDKKFALFDQPIFFNLHNDIWPSFFEPFKLIVIYRDFYDQIAELVRQHIYLDIENPTRALVSLFGDSRKGAIKYESLSALHRFERAKELEKLHGADRVLLLSFESLVQDYENQKSIIEKFVGLDPSDCRNEFEYFNPEKSVKNIGISKDILSSDELEIVSAAIELSNNIGVSTSIDSIFSDSSSTTRAVIEHNNVRAEVLTGDDCAEGLPKISVCIASYNHSEFIEQALESVFSQGYKNLEVIVVDDCSTDGSVAVLNKLAKKYPINLILSEENQGPSLAANKAFFEAKGEYVALLGSDDLMLPGRLHAQAKYLMEHGNVVAVFTDMQIFDKSGNRPQNAEQIDAAFNLQYFNVRKQLLAGNILTAPSAMIRRKDLLAVNCYSPLLRYVQDFELWGKLLSRGEVGKIDKPLTGYRVHGDNLSFGLKGEALWQSRVELVSSIVGFVKQWPIRSIVQLSKVSQEQELEILLGLATVLQLVDFYYFQKPSMGCGFAYDLIVKASYIEHNKASVAKSALEKVLSYGFSCFDELLTDEAVKWFGDILPRLYSAYKKPSNSLSVFAFEYSEYTNAPVFSVVLTTYNRPQLLIYALDSLSEQQFKDFEVLLVNDCGDAVEALLSGYSFPITYVKQGVNQGLSAARNAALKIARGKYICYLDDDDIYLPNHLSVLASMFENEPDSVVYTQARYVSEKIDDGKRIQISSGLPLAHDSFDKNKLFVQNYIPVNVWSHPRKVLQNIGLFDTSLSAFEDWDMLLRLVSCLPVKQSKEVTAEVRTRDQQGDHMLQRERKNFSELYQKIYERFPVEDSEVQEARNKVLRGMGVKIPGDTTANLSTWLDSRVLPANKQKHLQLGDSGVTAFVLACTGLENELVAKLEHNDAIDVKYVVTSQQYLDGVTPAEKSIVLEADNIGEFLNLQVQHCSSDWVIFLQGSDEFAQGGLLMLEIELSQNPALSAISFDEIYRQPDQSLAAAFKPANNLDYHLSFPAASSLHWLFNRKALLDIGGFDTSLPDAFELDAILRLINQHGLDKLGHIPEPLVITQPPALANVDDERIAIERHLRERGYEHAQVHAPNPGRYQIRYNHPQQPVVSVVLAAGKHLDKLQRCVEGLLGSTSYQTFEILFIDQPDSSAEVKQWLGELAAMQEPKLRVHSTRQKSLAVQYNEAHEHAIGGYLLFLSADVAVISEHWLDEMLNHAQRGEVGIVGAKLLTSDGQIAHAGHILGLHGPVGSPFVGEPMDAPGYMQRLQVDQNLSSVGGDCMMVLKQLFTELGGFDASGLDDAYLSTDFCLRSSEAGFLTVWTPHAQLMLDRDARPAPDSAAEDLMYDKWLPQLARDPAYNPNFSLSMPGGYMLADSQISWRPLDSIRPAPVALIHPADLFGCGHYRLMQPFLAMKEAGLMDGAISTGLMHVTDLERYNPDTIILQRQIGDARLEAMRRMQRFSRAFKVYELDDYLPNLPLKSVHRKDMPKDILKSLRRGLGFVDRFVVSTNALAEAFAGLHGEIVVCENRLPMSWWDGLQTKRRQGKKPRVGWAGGSSHTGDLELIADVVRDLADEVEWVFFGMCPEALKPYVHEFHGGVAIEQYPAKLASLNLDLGLAPLEHNLFNECKSNLRQLEYGACGIPIICTDIRPYQDGLNAGLPVTLVKNRYKDWVDAIRMHINDLDATARMADELQAKVKADWMLQGRYLEDWRNAWLGN